jgi:hypothetical protein
VHLADDLHRLAQGQFVQRGRDRALHRVLQRHDGRVHVAAAQRVQCGGDGGERDVLRVIGVRD